MSLRYAQYFYLLLLFSVLYSPFVPHDMSGPIVLLDVI